MEEVSRVEMVLLIGLQASGKSTFYRSRLAATHAHISKDLFPKVKNASARQQRLIEEALAQQQSVAIDNTNPSVEVRAALLALAKRHGARCVGYYFSSKVRECLERNRLRVGAAQVPDVAIFSTIKKLAPPTMSEGFGALFYVQMLPSHGFEVSAWDGSLA